jgi:predicted RNA binding protein YcfA (HicA-like mRNA interferase family)
MSAAHPPIRLLRNVATSRIVRVLEQDGFQFIERKAGQRVYHHQDGRFVVVHYLRAKDTVPRWHPLERGRPAPPQAGQVARRSTSDESGRPEGRRANWLPAIRRHPGRQSRI